MTVSDQALERLARDYDFWASTLFKIRDKTNALVPLELNDVQKAIGKAEQEEREKNSDGNVRLYVLKARQGGVSTDQQARNLHCIWMTPGARVLTLAHAREDTDKLFQITRRAIQNFDKDLLPTMGKGEAKEITFTGVDSAFYTGTAGASRVGRGLTLTRLHGSEFAFWNDPRAVLGSVSPALIPHNSVVVLETTPDRYESEAHKFWRESKEGKTGYRTLFFPWWECDKRFYRLPLLSDDELGELAEDEQSLVETFGVTKEELKWRRSKIKELGRAQFLREYPEDDETCWMTAGNKFYDSEKIEILLRKAPKSIEVKNGGLIKIFQNRAVQLHGGIVFEDVIIGADVAEGSGGDRTTWTARSFPSWRLLSQFASDRIDPTAFGGLLHKFGLDEYGEALLVVEKNFHGITTLRSLRDTFKYPRRSIYHRTPLGQDRDEKTDYIGWTTTGESKPLMLDHGTQILNAAADGLIGCPSRDTLVDFLAVSDGVLTGRDLLVSEMLCWIGREYMARRRASKGLPAPAPIHW